MSLQTEVIKEPFCATALVKLSLYCIHGINNMLIVQKNDKKFVSVNCVNSINVICYTGFSDYGHSFKDDHFIWIRPRCQGDFVFTQIFHCYRPPYCRLYTYNPFCFSCWLCLSQRLACLPTDSFNYGLISDHFSTNQRAGLPVSQPRPWSLLSLHPGICHSARGG